MIWKKGRKKLQQETLSVKMACWLRPVLPSEAHKRVDFMAKRRFGRMLAWVKECSSIKGSFLEIGLIGEDRQQSLSLVAGEENDEFKILLSMVVGTHESTNQGTASETTNDEGNQQREVGNIKSGTRKSGTKFES